MTLRYLGAYAVEFFFVLSGFIILYVHGRDLGTPTALPRYAYRRAVRILPTYWLILLGGMFYALHISHELFGTAVGGVLRRAHLASWPLLVGGLCAAAALIGAYLVYRLFERPLLKRLNATRPRRGSSEAEGPGTTPPLRYSSSSNDTALAPVADSHTWSPSMSATRPSEM